MKKITTNMKKINENTKVTLTFKQLKKLVKEASNRWFYTVYELDDNGEEVDQIKSFKTLDLAIKFAKKQKFPTHICYLAAQDPDDYGEECGPDGYSYAEVVWSSEEN